MAKIAENTVIVDGQEYKPGDVIPDFKSIKCVDTREPRKYQGLSADVSVLNDVIAKYASGGASCFMSDTGEYYEYDRKEKAWKLITNITERGFDSEKAYGALKHMLKNVTVSDEKIQSAVTNYLTVNPVLPGATTEQAQQIEQNKTDVASLKEETGSLREDLSNKITKFYASSQGETHITDSDNGKIMDMKVFGKSSQDGTPSPENPVEIKSVVNPMIKVCGVNLFDQTKVFKNIDIGIRSIVGINCYNIVGNGQSTDRRYYLIECKPNTKYYITFVNSNNNIFIGVADKNYIGIKDVSIFENITSKTFTTGNNAKFIVLNADGTSNICISEDNAAFEPYHEQTIQLPYTLNAIPVASGGNVTIDGQQYVADYVDVERGKLVRMVGVTDQDTFTTTKWSTGSIVIYSQLSNVGTENAIVNISSEFKEDWPAGDEIHHFTQPTGQTLVIVLPKTITTIEQGEEIRAKGFKFYYILVTPIEIDLTTEEITAFKALVTYYPTTNISVNSEQLDGYTVFNYPISMQNGWNYVKQQLNDNRDYIYDMDLQSAEAYVNSEYAVALTELEV